MGLSRRRGSQSELRSVSDWGNIKPRSLIPSVPSDVSVSEAVQKLKSNSSRRLRENGAWIGWQEGYGAFSVSASNVDAVRHYIQNQAEHHRRRSFEEEFVALLDKSGIAFNRTEIFS